uniref:GCN5-like N-acetyltransferase n=1 Tax=Kumanoa americana TaxID=1196377 RepID=A0A1C9CGL7_9FLOR|nr:GCN5-like N-acetyltransferase [Kumanoa americana]AOM67540.1 GCN5-like N-acetyltransferase [Kumanoa americana]
MNNFKICDKIILIDKLNYKGNQVDIYLSTKKDINLYDLEKLCDSVGWVRRPFRKVKTAIEHSFLIISLFHVQNNSNVLIGFARATSDHAFNATIWDVVIHPDFQGKGLGKTLMVQIIQHLRSADITTITLFADPQVVTFYKNLGFILDPDGVRGMFWYPR